MATTSWSQLVVATQTRVPHTPGILYEYKKKGLTKIAFRKLLILKGASCFAIRCSEECQKEKARRDDRRAQKNPQDYLKPILAKEPDRVKGIRAGERVRTLEDIHPSRCEGHLACLCADFAFFNALEGDRGDSNAQAGNRSTRHGRDGQPSRGNSRSVAREAGGR